MKPFLKRCTANPLCTRVVFLGRIKCVDVKRWWATERSRTCKHRHYLLLRWRRCVCSTTPIKADFCWRIQRPKGRYNIKNRFSVNESQIRFHGHKFASIHIECRRSDIPMNAATAMNSIWLHVHGQQSLLFTSNRRRACKKSRARNFGDAAFDIANTILLLFHDHGCVALIQHQTLVFFNGVQGETPAITFHGRINARVGCRNQNTEFSDFWCICIPNTSCHNHRIVQFIESTDLHKNSRFRPIFCRHFIIELAVKCMHTETTCWKSSTTRSCSTTAFFGGSAFRSRF